MFIYIPKELVALLTFPGVVLHEFAHRFFCDVTKHSVYKACYFKLDGTNTVGYVLHEPSKNIHSAFLISLGPLIINTALCIMLILPGILYFFVLSAGPSLLLGFLMWVGISFGWHASPSDTDVNSLLDSLTHLGASRSTLMITRILCFIPSFLGPLIIISLLSLYWYLII